MAKMPKGTGDFHPPEDVDPPVCQTCGGSGIVTDGCVSCGSVGCDGAHWEDCPDCGGTGREPAPDFEPDFDPEHDTPPYEGP